MRKIFVVMDYVCNNECLSCAKKSEKRGSLSSEQILQYMEQINPGVEDFIELSGGEPTLRKDLLNLCRKIKEEYKTNLIVLSNGRRFSDRKFAKDFKATGIDRVMTAFYSPDKEIHDQVTQRVGSFSESVRGLENLEELRMPISIKTIIIQQNYRQLPRFVNFAYDTFPSAWVSLHGLIMRGSARDNAEQVVPRYSNIKPFVEDALDIAIGRGENLGVFMLPSCIIDPIYWKYLSINWKEMSESMIYLSPERNVFGNIETTQPKYCEGCFIGDGCSWAWESGWKEYIDSFGTKELNKVTPDMIKWK